MLVDSSLFAGKTIELIHTFACEQVHPAWVDEFTTPIATSMAVLQLSCGRLLLLSPCEVELDPDRYPALGLEVTECDSSALQWQEPSGDIYRMSALEAADELLPFAVESIVRADPLGGGAVSELAFVSANGRHILFRHIMPPMTLGIDLTQPSQVI
jgi:hypothetical protein